jgi:hypothetical protein
MLLACNPEDPSYRYGVLLNTLEFELYTTDMGVHPDSSVLDAPENPFSAGLTGDTKWDVLEDGPVAGFYAWATTLVGIPTGEHQFYTALQLHQIYDQDLARPEDAVYVRDMAIRGYQSTLDNFPGAVTYDATGRVPFEVGPLAIDGILALGGIVENGWVKVITPTGGATAIRPE